MYTPLSLSKKITIIAALTVTVATLLSSAAFAANKKINLTSPAFKNGREIPLKYVLPESLIPGAEGLSPPLAWTISQKDAKKIKSFALIMVDLHPIAKKWIHWAMVNIGADERSLNEGGYSGDTTPSGVGKLLQNTFGFTAYGGPNPPEGSGMHTYEFTLYGLNVGKVDAPDDVELSLKDFQKLLKGKIVVQGKLKGKFKYSPPPNIALVPDGEHTIAAKVVEIGADGFSPSILTIKEGETVQFINKDTEPHWPASAVHPTHTAYPETGGCIGSKFDACAVLKQNETFNFTFNKIGAWEYHDHLNPGITGKIIVE
ncbi:YbhB/YbcL family Raf kinase inhibitor-like protein [Candidatus Peregrinibacteria bacterium]|nr:YbhB/YbcL family Raf kinase inhibitor-like protein [Candidatus Peregrinibacteria bacterium]